MLRDRISDYFEGVAAKYLSAVDARPEKSNQHEIGGLVRAGFDEYLGRPEKGTVISFTARMAYLRDGDDAPLVCTDEVSWYDSRHSGRGPEYRLYYRSNEVTSELSEGDFFLLGKLHDGSLLLVFAAAGSTSELQLKAIFGLEDVSERFQQGGLDASGLLLPLRLVLEGIGLALSRPAVDDDEWLSRILSEFGTAGFPSTSEFSEFARSTLEVEVRPVAAPDEALIEWMGHEERLFRILERYMVRHRLQKGFGIDGDDVDEFVAFSLSVQNRRKSRVGRALENHLAAIFMENKIRFQRGGGANVTENNSKPDFMFPGFAEYGDPGFPASGLRLLGAKTTCKDRWRQVLAEGARVSPKHLVTLEAAISGSQTEEMAATGLRLVVPKPIHVTYSRVQRGWLMSVAEFIEEVRRQQNP